MVHGSRRHVMGCSALVPHLVACPRLPMLSKEPMWVQWPGHKEERGAGNKG